MMKRYSKFGLNVVVALGTTTAVAVSMSVGVVTGVVREPAAFIVTGVGIVVLANSLQYVYFRPTPCESWSRRRIKPASWTAGGIVSIVGSAIIALVVFPASSWLYTVAITGPVLITLLQAVYLPTVGRYAYNRTHPRWQYLIAVFLSGQLAVYVVFLLIGSISVRGVYFWWATVIVLGLLFYGERIQYLLRSERQTSLSEWTTESENPGPEE